MNLRNFCSTVFGSSGRVLPRGAQESRPIRLRSRVDGLFGSRSTREDLWPERTRNIATSRTATAAR
ncbi:hypothetical protein GCM10010297_67480 [Streptomyces malachitofuscus]|nr:hypothetical protein GCM10010297_67480 [Streptomyces malachitofuscus]